MLTKIKWTKFDGIGTTNFRTSYAALVAEVALASVIAALAIGYPAIVICVALAWLAGAIFKTTALAEKAVDPFYEPRSSNFLRVTALVEQMMWLAAISSAAACFGPLPGFTTVLVIYVIVRWMPTRIRIFSRELAIWPHP